VTCEIDIDECLQRVPCKNGGTCIDMPGHAACACPQGLKGYDCTIGNVSCAEA
ncbi:MAG: calcium-binding EGF-like domain-containing protein, partial [Gammaproteobacteria bacterium]|nr:calcium-binding EGF-like domain-containing protein [Gammaproteobacteria bacterium]